MTEILHFKKRCEIKDKRKLVAKHRTNLRLENKLIGRALSTLA